MNAQQARFIANLLVTDEACFMDNGLTNLHNTHFRPTDNPYAILWDHFLHQFSLNLWARNVDEPLIGLFT